MPRLCFLYFTPTLRRTMTKPCIVFLYTELAGYIRACMEHLARQGCEVHVFAYPVNAEAPFEFDPAGAACHYYPRFDYGREQLSEKVQSLSPHLVVCSGWIDKDYVALCKRLRGQAATVLALDNQLDGSMKAKASALRAKVRFKPAFDLAWVPGAPQVAFARAMGFASGDIHTGFYTADVTSFERARGRRGGGPPAKRFVYVGRYIDFKGVEALWEAFRTLDAPGWELWCAGTGPLYDARPEMPGLRHLGFVQPADLDTFVGEGGVFVLPSLREPWGVVVHEFAAAGFPMICSTAVGAATAFLKEGENGYTVRPGDVNALREAMERIAALAPTEIEAMGVVSAHLAARYTRDTWTQTVMDIWAARKK